VTGLNLARNLLSGGPNAQARTEAAAKAEGNGAAVITDAR
jgi:hypothetical protein